MEITQKISEDLKAAGVPKNFKLYTTDHEDSFFDCVSEALKNVRSRLSCDPEKLRKDVKDWVKKIFKENKEVVENALKLRDNFTSIGDYLYKIEYGPLEVTEFDVGQPILGLPDVEGYFICQMYKVQLHVLIYNEAENRYEHRILDKDQQCTKTDVSYNDTNCIHIVQQNSNQFQAILRSENVIQTDNNKSNKKRAGTVNYGKDYEDYISTLLAVKCALNEKVEDFTIETNVDGYGAFDDVVLKLILEDNEEHICLIQLKYKGDTITFTNAFKAKSGIFQLEKYRDSYDKLPIENKENVHLILFTNTKFKEKTPKELDIYEENSVILSLVNTKEKGKIFKMKDSLEDQFLSKLFVATEQIDENKIATCLKEEIKKCLNLTDFDLNQTCIDKILKNFKKWNQSPAPIECKKIRSFLYETLLSPHLYEYIPQENNSECNDVVINTFNQFNSAFVSEENAKILQNSIFTYIEHYFNKLDFKMDSWEKDLLQANLSPIFDKNNTQFDLYRTHFGEIQKVNEAVKTRDVYLILSRHRKIPMAVRYNQQNKQMIDSMFTSTIFEDVYKRRSTVLVKENENVADSPFSNQFVNLFNLKEKNIKLFNNNLKLINVRFGQNKKCTKLKHLIQSKNETTLIETISPDVYLHLTWQTLYFGQSNSQIKYYVKRSITINLLNQSVFSEPDLFILTDYNKYDDNFNFPNVLLSKASLNEIKKAIRLLRKPSDQSIHIVRPVGENILELIYSDGLVKNLSKHQINKNYPEQGIIPENDIFKLFSNNKVQAICCNAGLGKTTFLKRIQELEEKKGRCAVFLNLTTDAKLLENLDDLETPENVRKVLGLFENNIESTYEFRQEIFLHYFRIGKITWLIDGFDEVDSSKIQPFLNYIKNTRNRILIATRPTKQGEIESCFNSLCLDLVPFSKENQIEFFENYFERKFSPDIIRRKLSSLSKLDEMLIGIPLQTKLCADLFEEIDDMEQTEVSIVFLFDNFLQKITKRDKEFEKKLSKLSLNLFFTQDLLVNASLFSDDIEDTKRSFKENEKKDFIISGFTDTNEPIFTHRTYAEYLCAKWLVQKLKDKESVELYKNLYKKLFCKTLTQVRIFFDKIVSENLKLHSAVLNEDIETVKKLLDEDIELLNETDVFGRTALHIASSYGKSLIIHTEDDIHGVKSGGEFIHFSTNNNDFQIEEVSLHEEESVTVSDIVEYMLEKGAKNKKDKLLEEDVIGYGLKSCSLDVCDKLCGKFTVGQQNIYPKIPIVFYFSIKYGLNNLFKFILDKEHLNVENGKYNKENLLFLAVKNNNVQIVKHLCENGTQVDLTNQLGYSALMCAAQMGHLKIVEYLLSEGADWRKTNTSGKTAIHLAIENGHTEIVKVKTLQTVLHTLVKDNDFKMINNLINLGFEIDVADNNNKTPLHIAAQEGKLNILDMLINVGANCNKLGFIKRNLLHQCAFNDNVAILDRLLDMGLAIDFTDEEGATPIHIAAWQGNFNVFDRLLKEGADYKILGYGNRNLLHQCAFNDNVAILNRVLDLELAIDSTDNNGNTPLHIAAKKGNLKVLNRLLETNADYKKLNDKNRNLLHQCALNDNVSVLDRILSLGFKIDSNDKDGETPLHIAAAKGNLHVLNRLLEKGADHNKLDFNERNLLHQCAFNDNVSVLDRVLSLGFAIDSVNHKKYTPLLIAANKGNLSVLNKLLEKGADHNKTDYKNRNLLHQCTFNDNVLLLDRVLALKFTIDSIGYNNNTPLHIAAQKGNLNVLNGLLKNGANYNKLGCKNRNLLHQCAFNDNVSVLDRVLSLGLAVDSTDNDKNTPLHIAAQKGNLNVLNRLLENGADYNKLDSNGRNLLHQCIFNDNVSILDRVLGLGLSTDSTDNNDNTPLHIAAEEDNLNILNRLIENGADYNKLGFENKNLLHQCAFNDNVAILDRILDLGLSINSTDNNDFTPLHIAVMEGNLNVFSRLLEKGADYNKLDIKGQNLFHYAIVSDNEEILEKVYSLGIYINNTDTLNRTPLSLAKSLKKLKSIKWLKLHGAT